MNLTRTVVLGRNGTTVLLWHFRLAHFRRQIIILKDREAALSPNCSNHERISPSWSTNFIVYLLPHYWILPCIAMIHINVCFFVCFAQMEDPAIHWQIALYRNLPYHFDNSNPEKIVGRVLRIANVLFHLDQVCECGCVLSI